MNPKLLGALRALGLVILAAILHFLGDATNLGFISSPGVVTIVSMIALAIEHGMEAKSGNALFGVVKGKKV